MKYVVLLATMLMCGCTISPNIDRWNGMLSSTTTTGGVSSDVTASNHVLNDTSVSDSESASTRTNGILTNQPPPPLSDAYTNIRTDNLSFYEYVNDFNWYMNYLFSYTIILNNYAESRGWMRLNTEPICRTVGPKVMEELPDFQPKSDPKSDLSRFEWDLVDYIKVIKGKYQDASDAFDSVQANQRILCIY